MLIEGHLEVVDFVLSNLNLLAVMFTFYTLQIYTITLHLFYILKDVILQPNEATNIGCTLLQLLYNYYITNSSIHYNILYEQLIFVRITAIGSTRQVCTSLLQLKRSTLSLTTAG